MKKLTYEQAVKELEEVVNLLDSGDLPLDESIKLYTKGAELAAMCEEHIKNAKLKIETIAYKNAQAEG